MHVLFRQLNWLRLHILRLYGWFRLIELHLQLLSLRVLTLEVGVLSMSGMYVLFDWR